MNWFKQLLEADDTPRNWLIRHSLYWVVFTGSVAVVWIYWMGSFQESLKAIVEGYPINLSLTYLFLYFVLPKLVQGQYRQFGFRLLVYVLANFGIRSFYLLVLSDRLSQTAFSDNPVRILFDTSFMNFNNFVVVAAALKMFRYWYRKEQANQQLIRETLLIELQVLRAQVHPHFLFNTLNNIYSLTLRKADNAPEIVHRLSGLLRYMFRECNVPMVPLTKEINLIQDYTRLEQIRYGNRLTISLAFKGELANKQIAPLLLIPFVENAFKHGASEQTGQAFINLTMLGVGNQLIVSLENSKNVSSAGSGHTNGGLGLANVRKRLALIYPDRHQLTIRSETTRYLVELMIQLN